VGPRAVLDELVKRKVLIPRWKSNPVHVPPVESVRCKIDF